jgi:hypothetical protein
MKHIKILAWIIVGLCFVTQSKAAEKHGGNVVTKDSAVGISLKPFGLKAHDLSMAKLILASHSPKTGSGKERIEILGTGEIRMIRSANYKAPEEVKSAMVKVSDVAALLNLMETEGFMQLNDEYKGSSIHSLRSQITLTLPGGEKSVFAENIAAPPAFERMVGAILLLAGIANPLVFNHQYFNRF